MSIRIPANPLFPFAMSLAAALYAAETRPGTTPPGSGKTDKTKVLEAGAKAFQGRGPVGRFDLYMIGFHPMKAHPSHAMEAHHFCRQVNQDFAQCALFDGNSPDANLNGIEYIVSEKLFETLPAEERRFWHPHNYEILSGQLVMPGLPGAAEKRALADKMNSYGKTWHLWNTGRDGKPGDKLPLGEPELAWSYNADGEIPPGMLSGLEKETGIDLAEKRRERADLAKLAKPQAGVDELKAAFPDRKPLPAVIDRDTVGSDAPARTR